ncbi:MAG: MAPEG family protein [Rhodobacteraceae bacterium]|nr:MAPEG family protein [Paracoccaceae bacterium]
MSSELSVLALYGLVLMFILAVQVTLSLPQLGMVYLATARDEGHKTSGIAARAERCLTNSVTAMVLFAPAVLLLAVKDAFTANTLLASQAFLIARIAYAPAYWLGIPWARTAIWAVGFLATAWLYLMALK